MIQIPRASYLRTSTIIVASFRVILVGCSRFRHWRRTSTICAAGPECLQARTEKGAGLPTCHMPLSNVSAKQAEFGGDICISAEQQSRRLALHVRVG